MEVGAWRKILRHESWFYGTQQASKLCNALTRDKGTWSVLVYFRQELLPTENRSENKDWVRRVPATAVILAVRVMVTIIGSKASVAGLLSSW